MTGNDESLLTLMRILHGDLSKLREEVGKVREEVSSMRGGNKMLASVLGFFSGAIAYVVGKLFF